MTETLIRPTTLEPGGTGQWCDEFDESMVCTQVVQVTHDVRSFVLRPDAPRMFTFDPGQHLTLRVVVDAVPLERCYTIASSPRWPDALTITVKRVPGGPVSNWLHDHVRPGDRLAVSGPLGEFTTTRHPAGRYLFLSAGSGITPLMSMTRTIHERREPADVVFVHNARTPDDIIFREELQRIAAEHPGIRVIAICEDDSVRERWAGPRGRLTLPMLEAIVPDAAEREVFTCGPPPYMTAVREILAGVGAAPERCHEETFTFAGAPLPGDEPPPAPADTGVQTYQVEFRRSGRTVDCPADSTVLTAAARAGLTLPSSCGEGVCGTCKNTMLAGSVDMQHAGGIRPREIAQNKILLCCSKPCEDLVIDA